jgi:hypothetical protein
MNRNSWFIIILIIFGFIFLAFSFKMQDNQRRITSSHSAISIPPTDRPAVSQKAILGEPYSDEPRVEPPRDRGPDMFGGGPPGNPEQEINDFFQWVQKDDPERYQEIIRLKEANPEVYRRVVFEGARHYHHIKTLEKTDPQAYSRMKEELKLDSSMRKLARKYKAEKDPAKQQNIKTELTGILEKLFDIRTRNREAEVARLQEKVNQLKVLVENRKNQKSTIVKKKFDEVVGQIENLDW